MFLHLLDDLRIQYSSIVWRWSYLCLGWYQKRKRLWSSHPHLNSQPCQSSLEILTFDRTLKEDCSKVLQERQACCICSSRLLSQYQRQVLECTQPGEVEWFYPDSNCSNCRGHSALSNWRHLIDSSSTLNWKSSCCVQYLDFRVSCAHTCSKKRLWLRVPLDLSSRTQWDECNEPEKRFYFHQMALLDMHSGHIWFLP